MRILTGQHFTDLVPFPDGRFVPGITAEHIETAVAVKVRNSRSLKLGLIIHRVFLLKSVLFLLIRLRRNVWKSKKKTIRKENVERPKRHERSPSEFLKSK